MRDTLDLMEPLAAWTDEMIALETATLARVAKLGAKIQTLLRRKT